MPSTATNTSTFISEPHGTDAEGAILLRPRPLARRAGAFQLLPLLPKRPPFKHLPSEVWAHIFTIVLEGSNDGGMPVRGPVNLRALGSRKVSAVDLLVVCKTFKDIALPVFYTHVRITSVASFERFVAHLHASDQRWDSVHRIPYSTPGRWVQAIDLSDLDLGDAVPSADDERALKRRFDTRLLIDGLLTRLFPLLPFLARFELPSALPLSRRAMASLAFRDPGSARLRVLRGLRLSPLLPTFSPETMPFALEEDPVIQLLRGCPNLEELHVVGLDLDDLDLDTLLAAPTVEAPPPPTHPMNLPKLHTLALLSTHASPVLYALVHAPLPALCDLSLTPYEDVPGSLIGAFIAAHGPKLHQLVLQSPNLSWPSMSHPSPDGLLESCPNLQHLSLDSPLPELKLAEPVLALAPSSPDAPPPAPKTHPLELLTLPRPNADFLVESLEPLLPVMPALKAVRVRDVRWLRAGMGGRAKEAGVQGEMREWRRRLSRRGVAMLDGDWSDGARTWI